MENSEASSDKVLTAVTGNHGLSKTDGVPDTVITGRGLDQGINQAAELPKQVTETKPEIPEHLQGKSYEELVADYRSLESKLGRQANEIGTLRKAIEEVQVPAQHYEPVDFYEDPDAAMEQHLAPLRAELSQLQAEKARAELSASHPDWQDIAKDDSFVEWIKEKESRTLLAISGDRGNVKAAKELLDDFKAWKAGDEPSSTKQKRDRLVASVGAERGSGRRPSGDIYSRAELRNLRAQNPQRYNELMPSIKAAYRDGRVRD